MEAKIAVGETFLVVVKTVVKSFCFPLSRYFFNLLPVKRLGSIFSCTEANRFYS